MTFDLYARNKRSPAGEHFGIGGHFWHWLLDEGVGLPLGTGRSVDPASFRYLPDAQGRCPRYNDGFRVTAEQVRAMALCARGLVSVQRGIRTEWEAFSEEERQRREAWEQRWHDGMYRVPVREDFIDKAEQFAEWAEQSRGFSVR